MELHFFFFFLMEVNSCLTILPSDVFGRELGKLRRPRSAVGGVCCRGFQHPLRPRQETRAAASLTSPTPRPAACTRPPQNVPGGTLACAQRPSHSPFTETRRRVGHLRRAVPAGRNATCRVLKEKKRRRSRERRVDSDNIFLHVIQSSRTPDRTLLVFHI